MASKMQQCLNTSGYTLIVTVCLQQHMVAEGNGGRWRVMKLPVMCSRTDWSVRRTG